MADMLNCDCLIHTARGSDYWWPLVCEVLESHHFYFVSPWLNGKSSYTFIRDLPPYTDDTQEVESVQGTLQDVSHELSTEVGGVVALFWATEDDGDALEVDVSFRLDKEKKELSIGLGIPGGQIRDVPEEKARARLKHIFSCTKTLYEVCQPRSGEMYWENSTYDFAPWAVIGDTSEPLFAHNALHPAINSVNQQVIQQQLQNEKTLFFLDPPPVLRRQGEHKQWEFLSLRE